jgi:hypothetical protein
VLKRDGIEVVRNGILAAYRKIFKTESGKTVCRKMFGIEE